MLATKSRPTLSTIRLRDGHVSSRLGYREWYHCVIKLCYLLVESWQPKLYATDRSALANRDHYAASSESTMPAPQPVPGGFGDGQSRVGSWPLTPAHQGRILHPEPRLQPFCLLRAGRYWRLHDHDGGHIKQTSCHAQPKFAGSRHHHSPLEIDSESCCCLQSEVGSSHNADPISSL